MFFSIVFGIACGGMIISILGLINPSWIGSDDKDLIYASAKGWLLILFIIIFFYDADSFNEIVWFISIFIGVGMNYIKVRISD